jgi:hypothetical protein
MRNALSARGRAASEGGALQAGCAPHSLIIRKYPDPVNPLSVRPNFRCADRVLRTDHGEQAALEAPMFNDQITTLIVALLGPLLLFNAVGLARLASSSIRSIAGTAVRAVRLG